VPAIRMVVVTMPPLLSDLVASLVEDRATLSVIARLDTRLEIESRLPALGPDLILVGLRDGEGDDIAETVRALMPTATVIALSSDARNAYVHDVGIHRTVLSDVAPRALVEVIVGARDLGRSRSDRSAWTPF
jgi:DNA-binding NarL/FixJ family response regulator